MSENLVIALQITVVGMGLVFASIILLWGLMEVLVRLMPERAEVNSDENTVEEAATTNTDSDLKKQVAAAAVAAALVYEAAHQGGNSAAAVPAANSSLSAWQAAARSAQLKRRGSK